MARPANQLDTSTYPARIAAKLRELRIEAGLSIEDVESRLAKLGRQVPRATLYAYERGKAAGGVDLPTSLIPLIARIYGLKAAGDWLPPR